MTVYLVLMALAAALGFIFCERGSKKTEYICLVSVAVMMCAAAALRSGSVGVDYDWVYRDYFVTVCENLRPEFIFSPQNMYRREFLYTLLNMAIACVSKEPLFMWGSVSVIIIALRMAFFARFSKKPWLSAYLYIALGFFGFSLCTLRQELAISIAMFALPYLQNRRPLPYLAIIIAAGFLHNSLFIMLPIYFFVLLPPENRLVQSLYAVGLMIMIMFSDTVLEWFTGVFPRFALYFENGYITNGRSIRHALIWIVLMTVCAFFYPRMIKKDAKLRPLFNLCLFGTLLITLMIKSFMYQRVALIFLPCFTLLIPEIVSALEPAAEAACQSTALPKKRQSKAQYADEKRFYLTILVLFIFIAALQFFFYRSIDQLQIFPYTAFWEAVP